MCIRDRVRSPVYTKKERELAARLRRTFTDSPEGSADTGTEFSEEPVPYQGLGGCLMASTDVYKRQRGACYEG